MLTRELAAENEFDEAERVSGGIVELGTDAEDNVFLGPRIPKGMRYVHSSPSRTHLEHAWVWIVSPDEGK